MPSTLARPDHDLVAPIRALRRGDLAFAGGKGANLGELVGAGFPVPEGFVVSTAAYGSVVEQAGLRPIITDGLSRNDGAVIRGAFEQAVMPDPIAAAITEAYADLGGGPVAV